MTFGEFKKIFDQIRPLNLNLSGYGESFLNPHLMLMIRHAKKYGTKVNFATNLTLVENMVKDICLSGLDLLKISIDAATPQTYKKIRGIDHFDTVISNINKINAYKQQHHLNKPVLRFNFALQADNLEELEDVLRLAKRLRIEVVYVQYLEFVNMESRKKKLVGNLKIKSLTDKLKSAAKTADSLGVKTNLAMWLRDIDHYYGKMRPEPEFKDSNRICHFPWMTSYIEYNGDVRPCQMFVWKRGEGIMGNALKSDFKAVWNSQKYRDFRKMTKKRKRPFLPCRSCIPQTYGNILHIYTKLLPGWGAGK